MSWCDKLASVPTVGFKLDAHLVSGSALLEAFAPILAPDVGPDAIKFTVEQLDAFGTGVTTEDGFRYGADPWRISVAFTHRMKAQAVSGGPPVLEMMSRPLPYTQLLTSVSDRLVDATLLLPGISGRKINRVGVMSITQVDASDLPPGLQRMIDYMGRPWRGATGTLNFHIESLISQDEGWIDKCSHTINRPADDTQLMAIQFDYSREFNNGVNADVASMKRILKSTSEAALVYLEEIAEGSLFDEKFISDTIEA